MTVVAGPIGDVEYGATGFKSGSARVASGSRWDRRVEAGFGNLRRDGVDRHADRNSDDGGPGCHTVRIESCGGAVFGTSPFGK